MNDKLNKTDSRLDRIHILVDSMLSGTNLYRVHTRIKGSTQQPMVDIFIDGDKGVTIDQCASVSRRVAASIELESVFPKGFRLDVSSPGLGQPLRLPRQFRRHIGRTLEVLLRDSETEHRTPVSGKLVETAAVSITIDSGDHRFELRFDEIERAVVTPTF